MSLIQLVVSLGFYRGYRRVKIARARVNLCQLVAPAPPAKIIPFMYHCSVISLLYSLQFKLYITTMSGLFIMIVLIAIIFLPVLLANNRLSVSEYRISISGLPKEFDGFTVVQISDLHNKRFGGNQARIMRRIHTIDPDICAITGDFVKMIRRSSRNRKI